MSGASFASTWTVTSLGTSSAGLLEPLPRHLGHLEDSYATGPPQELDQSSPRLLVNPYRICVFDTHHHRCVEDPVTANLVVVVTS